MNDGAEWHGFGRAMISRSIYVYYICDIWYTYTYTVYTIQYNWHIYINTQQYIWYSWVYWMVYIYRGYRNMLSIQCRNHETKERIAPWGDDLLGRSLAPKKRAQSASKCPLFKLMFLIFLGVAIYIYIYIYYLIYYILYILYIYIWAKHTYIHVVAQNMKLSI